MPRYMVTADYVDTCHSDYLQDSYSRPGEWLLCTSLGGQADEEAVEELMIQMNGEAPPEDWPDEITDEQIRRALLDAVRPVDFRPVDENGNPVSEPCTDEDMSDEDYEALLQDEQPYVYVVLRWAPHAFETSAL